MNYWKNKPLEITATIIFLFSIVESAIGRQNLEKEPQKGNSSVAPITRVEISGTSTAYNPRKEDTFSRTVITQDEISKYGDYQISAILKRQPGIVVKGSEIQIRGFAGRYTQILVDGVEMPRGFDIDSISVTDIERIELLHAAIAEFSTQAIAGTINIILKKKVKKSGTDLKVTYDKNSIFLNRLIDAQYSEKGKAYSYRISAEISEKSYSEEIIASEAKESKDGERFEKRDGKYENSGNFPAIKLRLSSNWRNEDGAELSMQGLFREQNTILANVVHWRSSVDQTTRPTTENFSEKNQPRVAKLDLDYKKSLSDTLVLDAHLLLTNFKNNSTQEASATNSNQLSGNIQKTSQVLNNDAAAKFALQSNLFDGHTLKIGGDLHFESATDQQVLTTNRVVEMKERNEASAFKRAIYFQDEWAASKLLSVYLGLRWENLNQESGNKARTTVSNNFKVLSPLGQILYKIGNEGVDQLRFSVSKTFKQANILDLLPRVMLSGNNSPFNPDSMGNPNLLPETSFGFDVAYEKYVGDDTFFGTSIYAKKINDVVRPDLVFQNDKWIKVPINDGDAKVYGMTVELKFPSKLIFPSLDKVEVRFSQNRNFSSMSNIASANNRIRGQIPLSTNLSLDWHPSPRATLGGTFSLRKGTAIQISPTIVNVSANERDAELYSLFKFDDSSKLRIAATNIFARPSNEKAYYFYSDNNYYSEYSSRLRPSIKIVFERKF